MYTVQSLFFMLQNEYLNCIEILDTRMLHSSCNKTCIEKAMHQDDANATIPLERTP